MTPRVGVTRVILVRHGQSLSNLDDKIPHDSEVGLTEKGVEDAKRAAREVRKHSPTVVYSSNYERARRSAQIIASSLGLPEPKVDHGLHERNFGALPEKGYELSNVDGYLNKDGSINEKWKPSGGESLLDVQGRALPTLQKIAAAHPGETVVVVSHNHVIRAVTAHHQGDWKMKGPANGEHRVFDFPSHGRADGLIVKELTRCV